MSLALSKNSHLDLVALKSHDSKLSLFKVLIRKIVLKVVFRAYLLKYSNRDRKYISADKLHELLFNSSYSKVLNWEDLLK